ncbi:GtrA family protein [Pontibacter sp. G13]|uniref:GtrA family protein n=1 Tax=Pontibacter sp. G13 TaxID=3074898 RepID=UPI00288BF370|nr:GtrA family protein [Pontibacter sp. G13]WNJ17075.1 GtrA family protein [Pontibacter sp. G13]
MSAQASDLTSLPKLNQQIFSFALIGGLCYLIVIGLLYLFHDMLGWEINLSNALASLIVIGINYILNVKFVFERGRHSRTKEISAFVLFTGMGFGLNLLLMYGMTALHPLQFWDQSYLADTSDAPKIAAMFYIFYKTCGVGAVSVFNFLTRKFFVFKG